VVEDSGAVLLVLGEEIEVGGTGSFIQIVILPNAVF
jgi:hypothetical protein